MLLCGFFLPHGFKTQCLQFLGQRVVAKIRFQSGIGFIRNASGRYFLPVKSFRMIAQSLELFLLPAAFAAEAVVVLVVNQVKLARGDISHNKG